MISLDGIRTDARANLAGSLWMVAAMAGFAIEDSLVKILTARLPVAQVLVLFGLGGATIFAGIAAATRQNLFDRAVLSPAMRVRAGFEVTGRLFYTLALALTPLSATTAILQATPVVVVLGAALVFGERVGWRRWSAITLGLVGVMIVLRPTPDSFAPLSLLAVLGMLGFAGRDLASRAAPAALGTAALGFYGFLALMVAGLLFGAWEREAFLVPGGSEVLMFAAVALCGAAAYAMLMMAMRTGEVSTVTPFRYSRILFGIGLGVLVFGETVDLTMAVGCAVIVGSGLVILRRSQVPHAGP